MVAAVDTLSMAPNHVRLPWGSVVSDPKPTDSEGGGRTGQALWPQEERGEEL